ncbi:hypothetical protein QJS04_geneDACA020174 [Acorus gramineus]|uniref:Uncharacterized protein n=1 Tax=Acorus gramineus TaxID=55184 RepID=A0AAV9BR34_ACOGR|nr:hypothetical protein QJS04_geneDACA020174 [Acorus gramineus]
METRKLVNQIKGKERIKQVKKPNKQKRLKGLSNNLEQVVTTPTIALFPTSRQ